MVRRIALFLALGFGLVAVGRAQPPATSGCQALTAAKSCKVLNDFESEAPGRPPTNWRTTMNRQLVRLDEPDAMSPRQYVRVRAEGGNQFARIHTDDRAYRVVRSRKNGLEWNLDKRPRLRWTWRARSLPKGGNEKYDDTNDTGGAVYVTFGTDWLGRPISLKYTYSSALPVGTTVDYGSLQVIVVASKEEQGLNRWVTHERNVVKDYRRLFDEEPDPTPLAFMMWSDSDTLHGTGTIDVDNVLFLRRASEARSATASSK